MTINISDTIVRNLLATDAQLRAVIAGAVGVSTGPYGTILHLPDGVTAQQQSDAHSILSNYDSLTVNADKTTMTEGDVDPVVSCSDAVIANDADVSYIVLLDGVVYASGSTTVTAGVATLNLVSPVDGIYEIFIYRTTDNCASGSVTITVSEV